MKMRAWLKQLWRTAILSIRQKVYGQRVYAIARYRCCLCNNELFVYVGEGVGIKESHMEKRLAKVPQAIRCTQAEEFGHWMDLRTVTTLPELIIPSQYQLHWQWLGNKKGLALCSNGKKRQFCVSAHWA